MIVYFTKQDKKELERIEKEYDRKIADVQAKIERLRPSDQGPEGPTSATVGTPEAEEMDRQYKKWLSEGSQEWREAREEESRLMMEKSEAFHTFSRSVELREFAKLGGDREKIIESARSQATDLIKNRYDLFKEATKKGEPGERFSYRFMRVEGLKYWLDRETTISDLKECLTMHYEALRHDQEAIKALDKIILEAVESPLVSSEKGILGGFYTIQGDGAEIAVRSSRPTDYISPIDKVSNKAWEGVLNSTDLVGVEVIKKTKSRKPIYTMVSIDHSELEGVQINGRRELTPFDREVHDAIVTLLIEGGNQYITVNMIYQTMTGKSSAHCSPKQAEAISDSITKLMFSHAIIDATQEATVDKRISRARYDSNLLNAKRLTVSINGTTTEAIQVLATPILYDYANQKNQIGRFDMKLLDSPLNKNEETIILEGYLRRRVDTIKKGSLAPTILYETIYKQLDITAGSQASYNNKTKKIRDNVKRLLDFWKKEGFIKGYVENVHKNEKNKVVSITIRY